MRLFLAIEPPPPIRRLLGGVQEQLRKSIRGPIRWVDPVNFHFTLKFLGETPASQLGDLLAGLQVVRGTGFELQLKSVSQLPPEGRANVVIVDLACIPPEMLELHAAVETGCIALGFAGETRAYHPHLTLARLSVPRFVSRETDLPIPPAKFSVQEFLLMESTQTPAGSVYRAVERFPLASIQRAN